MIPIAPNPKTSHCCICKVAERDLDAFHAINEALIRGSRARASGKPPCTEIAKKFLYLWPNGKVDNLRKSLERHVGHLTEQMAEAREEEKEVARDLNDEVDEFVCMIKKNVQKLQEVAERSDDKKFWLYASQAAIPATGLLSKLTHPEKVEPLPSVTINFNKLSTEELEQYERLRAKLEGREEGTGTKEAA